MQATWLRQLKCGDWFVSTASFTFQGYKRDEKLHGLQVSIGKEEKTESWYGNCQNLENSAPSPVLLPSCE